MKWLIDYKAAPKYGNVILAEHPEGIGSGGFVHVDGWPIAIPTYDDLLATKRSPFCRLELAWDDNHRFGDDFVRLVQNNAKLSRPLLEKYPHIDFYVAPVTEHRLDKRSWDKFATVTENELRGLRYQLVNSPLREGFIHDSLINEQHGTDFKPRGKRFAHSYDGDNIVDSDVTKDKLLLKNAEYMSVWNSQFNGNRVIQERDEQGKPVKIPRDKRKFYVSAGSQYDSFLYVAINDRGDIRLPLGWTLKSHGDQHSVPPQGKDQKPVIITPKNEKYDQIVFKAKNGQVIDVAKYFGPLNEKPNGKLIGHRYYCTDWGFILSEKAKRISGDPVVEIWVKGKRVGRCNLAFRSGTFR
jgi:hypothetical protein